MATTPPVDQANDWHLAQSFASPQGKISWDAFGHGPSIVLLHGTPNWSFIWRKVVERLAPDFKVYAFDWPGFGRSDRFAGQNISWDEQARRLPELFDHWGLHSPIVVAFDFAPIFVLRAHFFAGLEISGLVLADAAVIPPFITDFSRLARDNMGVMRQLPTHIAEAMIAAHMAQTTHRPMAPDTLDAYLSPWRGDDGVAAYWRAVAAYDEQLAASLVARLPELELPARLLWGEHDAWFPEQMARDLAAAIPGAELRFIPDAGHFSPEENPDAFAAELRQFAQELDRSALAPAAFDPALLRAIEAAEKLPLHAGTRPHEFTGIWVVTVDGRVYVRSWKLRSERSWYHDLLRDRIGAILLDEQQITVEPRPVEQSRVLDDVDSAYHEKYGERWLPYVEDMVSPTSRQTTIELVPSPRHSRETDLQPFRT